MSRRIAVLVGLLLAFLAGAFLVTYIEKVRLSAHLRASENNLRQLALFAAFQANPKSGPLAKELPREIPAATLVLPGVPAENRLSWVVPILPGLDQSRNPIALLLEEIDVTQPWSAARNQQAAQLRLNVLLCPENTPQTRPGEAAITCYVGIAGLGVDAATLGLPKGGPTPSRAGAFRYDAPTPFDRITDGLSQTLLFAETAAEPGSWLRGGPATTRGLDDAATAKPLIGFDGQFGGFFPSGANFALCDGSVRLFTPYTTSAVLHQMATIAGSERDAIPE